jgi:hypothetical protein
MPTRQGSIALLSDPMAQELLRSASLARLGYVWPDGTPRVVPVWFHWNGKEVVLGTPAKAPYKVLQIRGTAQVETVTGVVPEYALAAERYFGADQGRAWVKQAESMFPRMIRIAVTPTWVGLLDFEKRFPSAIEAAMAGDTR